MDEVEHESMDVRGPKLKLSHVIAVTSTSANQDLSASASIGADVIAGRMLRMRADGGDVYYSWYVDGTGTIDDTATGTGATVAGGVIPAGQYVDERPPHEVSGNQRVPYMFLYVKTASGTAKLRIAATSERRY